MKNILILIVTIIVLAGLGIGYSNSFISQKEAIAGSWAEVENQMQRRYDLIPNLINTVKGYTKHESSIFTEIANSRAKLSGASSKAQKAEESVKIESALGRLLAIAESYPNLKADQSFLALQAELAGTENRMAVARKRYNDLVRDFNARIKGIPGRFMGYESEEYFKPANIEAVKNPPKVEF